MYWTGRKKPGGNGVWILSGHCSKLYQVKYQHVLTQPQDIRRFSVKLHYVCRDISQIVSIELSRFCQLFAYDRFKCNLNALWNTFKSVVSTICT